MATQLDPPVNKPSSSTSNQWCYTWIGMGLGGSSGSDGDGDVVEGIESKTGGDEGLAGQSWVLPCRRQYVPRRPRSALARRVPGPGAETLLEVIDFRTWPTPASWPQRKLCPRP